MTMPVPLHRDAPVTCPSCGRTVPRRARQQIYCSMACKREIAGRGVFGPRRWHQVVSSDDVVCEVSTLRPRALHNGGGGS
jgi:ribosomal protein L37AE/L43A